MIQMSEKTNNEDATLHHGNRRTAHYPKPPARLLPPPNTLNMGGTTDFQFCGECSATTSDGNPQLATEQQRSLPKPKPAPQPLRRLLPPPGALNMSGPADFQFCGECSDESQQADEPEHVPLHIKAASSEDEYAVKSTFFVQGICCYSEVPSIQRIVRPLPGVASLQINITTKRVYVQHNPDWIRASEIAQQLTKQGFPASLLHTGENKQRQTFVPATQSRLGRTTLQTEKILEEEDVQSVVLTLESLDGVEKAGFGDNKRVIYVEHNVHQISAHKLCVAVSKETASTTVLVQDAEALLAQTHETKAILSQPRSKFVESTIYIANLTTAHSTLCSKVIAQNFIRAQVRAFHSHASSRTAKIEHNPTTVPIEKVCNILERHGLDCSVVTDGHAEKLVLPMLDENTEQADEENADAELSDWQAANRVSTPVLFSGIFWVLSLLSVVDGMESLELPAGVLSVLFGLPPVALKALRTLRRFEFDSNCMMVTAALGALALGKFDEAASVAFLFSISEYLEAKATDRARNALAAIVQLRPEHANVINPETREIVVIPADRVPIGCLLSVRTGDKLPADGVVVEGTSQIDESSLTGESLPVQKKINDVVSGGGINVGPTHLVVRTTTSVEDSAVSRLIRLVEEAQANRSPTEKMIDGFARAYTPAVVFVAALLCTVPWLWGEEVGREWTLNGLIVIVIACPCALAISTPVTYSAGLAAAAQRGIVVKGGASLEALGDVSTVLLDKTGTLTEGKFKIQHLREIGQRSRKEMLQLLGIVEQLSAHPMSTTLVNAVVHEIGSIPDQDVKQHTTLKGEGVTAIVDDKRVFVGNTQLFERTGFVVPETYLSLSREWSDTGGSVGFIGIEDEGIIGIFCVTDVVRPESKAVIEELLKDGVDVQMLTGDSEGAALSVAQQVGLSEESVHARLFPEDKLQYVRSAKCPSSKSTYGLFRREPKVLFCGDGVNDAPALAAASVGVSMGEGAAALAQTTSDVTLMDSNLHKLLFVKKMGSRVLQTIRENIIMSLACKVIVVGLTFSGHMTLLYAVASDVGVMLLVTLNGMKLLPVNTNDLGLDRSRQSREEYSLVQQDNSGLYPQISCDDSIV